MTAPGFLVALVRGSVPGWWSPRVSDAQLALYGRALLKEWDAGQLFGEVECAPLVVKRLHQLAGDVAHFAGDGETVPRQREAERAALIQLVAVCLARLAANDRGPT